MIIIRPSYDSSLGSGCENWLEVVVSLKLENITYFFRITIVGCHADRVSMADTSYANDMVLLTPSIGALWDLLVICESYVVIDGLRNKALKSDLIILKSDSETYSEIVSVAHRCSR